MTASTRPTAPPDARKLPSGSRVHNVSDGLFEPKHLRYLGPCGPIVTFLYLVTLQRPDGWCAPPKGAAKLTRATLARAMGVEVITVQRHLDRLRAQKAPGPYIAVKRDGRGIGICILKNWKYFGAGSRTADTSRSRSISTETSEVSPLNGRSIPTDTSHHYREVPSSTDQSPLPPAGAGGSLDPPGGGNDHSQGTATATTTTPPGPTLRTFPTLRAAVQALADESGRTKDQVAWLLELLAQWKRAEVDAWLAGQGCRLGTAGPIPAPPETPRPPREPPQATIEPMDAADDTVPSPAALRALVASLEEQA